jgi:ferredoxin
MLANYGYKDGSGEFFITIDTDKCDGCGACLPVCPTQVLEVSPEDPNDPLREGPVAIVGEAQRKKLKYACAQCKPASSRPRLPCVEACPKEAIAHSW